MTNLPLKPCLFNFVLYIQDRTRTEYLQGIMHRILEKFPCCVIVIYADIQSKENSLSIKTEDKTYKTPLDEITYQEVAIEASGSEIKKVPLLIYPNLYPDIPTYLLWGVPPTQEMVILPELQRYAKCVIFDTDSVDDFCVFSEKMLQSIQNLPSDIVDMNWARSGGWRHVIAQVFDCSERIELLQNCKSVQITFNNIHAGYCHHTMIQALYLQGWLAAQMQWNAESWEENDKGAKLIYSYKGNSIIVDIISTDIPSFSPGAIAAVEVTADNQQFFVMTRNQDSPDLVHAYISSADFCELPFTCLLPAVQRSFAFIQDILYNPSYEHYTSMLQNLLKQCKVKSPQSNQSNEVCNKGFGL